MKFLRRRSIVALALVVAACDQGRGSMEIRKTDPIASVTQDIQGGTRDTTSSNVVGILINTAQGMAVCSGSLIAPNVVLTARHCVADSGAISCTGSTFGTTFAASSFRVTTSGTAAASVFNNGGPVPTVDNSTWFGVSAVSVPTTPANSICGGDMAILRLSTNITNICPLIPRVDAPVVLNEAYTAVGFGVLSPTGQTAGTRYTVSGLNVLCESNCGQGMDQAREWLGGTTAQRGVCEGDSGGPALDSMRRVLGTVSRGDASSCNEAVYDGVYGQAAWIKSVTAAAATAGGYTAPAWVTGAATDYNPCPGAIDGGVGTGGGAGGGGGTTGGTCSGSNVCTDATGAGDFACLTAAGAVPAGAPSCANNVACPTGFTCYQDGTSLICLEDCAGGATGGGTGTTGGGTGTTGGGTGTTGGGGGTTGGTCTVAGTTCVDASGQGDFACVSTTSSTGIPSGAATCSSSAPCAGGFSCWGTSSGNYCLQDCAATGTGGGTGTTGGGTGTVGGGTGTVGGGTGSVGGGTGSVGGGTGTTGGGTGTTGGGSGSVGGGAGTLGGGAGGGSGTGGSLGSNGFGGGSIIPIPDPPKKATGCSCTGVSDGVSVMWLGLAALTFMRRRRS